MRHRAGMGLILLVLVGAAWSFVQGDTKPSATERHEQQGALMRTKLASSQKITAGLVTKDFSEIRSGAEELRKVCAATEWASHSDQVYAHHRKELMLQAGRMIDAAEEKNLDGATYSYVHALTTCISCHAYCRDVLKIADRVPTTRVIPIPTSVP